MFPAKCDFDGNLYIRKYVTDRPLLGPVIKIDAEGKRVALFDPASVSQLQLSRADAFSPASDGALYQIAAVGIAKPQIYVLHFSSDGSFSSPIHIDADFQPFQFAAFADGNLLLSGFQRDAQNRSDARRPFTAVFSADGRMLAQISFDSSTSAKTPRAKAGAPPATEAEKSIPTLDLSDAESAPDGNIYVLRRSAPAVIYAISPAGHILRTIKISPPTPGETPNTFHISVNRFALSFWDEKTNHQSLVVADLQTGRRIATYSDPGTLGPTFACYSANDAAFTFLNLGEGNTLEVIRAEPR
jgi:hypothetical protein